MRMRHVVLLALLFVVGGFLWLVSRIEGRPDLDPPAIVTQVQQLSQLTTVRYTVQKVVAIEEPKYPVGLESILLILQASVEAGIDLASLREQDVTRDSTGAIRLRLPAAQILNVIVNEKETKVWDRRKTWWAPWTPYSKDLEQRARMTGLESIKKAALDMGILRQAERNAETSIRSLLTLAGVKSVVIIPAGAS
jgi:hypothetical protein